MDQHLAAGSKVSLGSRLPVLADYLFYGVTITVIWWGSRSVPHSLDIVIYFLLSFLVVLFWALLWRQFVTLTPEGVVIHRGVLQKQSILYEQISKVSWAPERTLRIDLASGGSLCLKVRSSRLESRLMALEKAIRREADVTGVVPSNQRR